MIVASFPDDLAKLSNKYISHPMVIAVVSVFIVIYSATIGPELPQSVKDFFSNDYAKFALIFITMWLASAKRPVIALISTLAFFFITSLVAEEKIIETFTSGGKSDRYRR